MKLTKSESPEPLRTNRRFTLSEKIAVVRESLVPGVSATHVARRHAIAVNVLYYWRKAYKDVVNTDLTKLQDGTAVEAQIADLRLQVRNLERLLGQRTLEIALLREQLGKGRDDEAEF
jgi:transposase